MNSISENDLSLICGGADSFWQDLGQFCGGFISGFGVVADIPGAPLSGAFTAGIIAAAIN